MEIMLNATISKACCLWPTSQLGKHKAYFPSFIRARSKHIFLILKILSHVKAKISSSINTLLLLLTAKSSQHRGVRPCVGSILLSAGEYSLKKKGFDFIIVMHTAQELNKNKGYPGSPLGT